MTGKTILITGANRGIGRGLFDHYAAQPGNTVVAAVRDPTRCRAELEAQSPRGAGTRLLVVGLDATSSASPSRAADELRAAGVGRLDVVVANAGVGKVARLEDASVADVETVVKVNGVAPLFLYQAMLPLMRAAAAAAKDAGEEGATLPVFALISSGGGSIAEAATSDAFALGVYGGSKALANFLTVKMGAENDWLITLCIAPGLVATDMAKLAEDSGIDFKVVGKTPQACAENTAHIIKNATKEEHSGKFFNETIDKFHAW
ncbi:hypothetical protein GGTG_08622 [Gaeumannomyces tritici R3-111a-1]|uniref:Aflatoxin biosynthesis ketoreductase nor-1 n=1 Tax=Gaeumannomyces tritici (strain R3-111a-1) TaxID=644352 RepID=J3P536_GAET3|nr:hypothetical protein GGTG_08622 [Gaeumannomyces tritici R3-111a-1]EJT74784.1 hypothetical protein GGTG_08622 [Gaeumannomyces tritici R3-111a-1]